MNMNLICPTCRRSQQVAEEIWGSEARCPYCESTFKAMMLTPIGPEPPPVRAEDRPSQARPSPGRSLSRCPKSGPGPRLRLPFDPQ